MRTQQAINMFLGSRQGLSPTTTQWYRHKLHAFAKACPELPEEPGTIQTHLAKVKGGPETKHAHYRALRAFFNLICAWHDTYNPMLKVVAPRCPRKVMATLEPWELMRLLSSATTLRDKTIIMLLIDTGMRSGELAGLRKQDTRPNAVTVCGKCGQRQIPISDEVGMLLQSLIAQDGASEYVFHGVKGRLTRHGVYRIVRAHFAKAGIAGPKLGGHRIRHAFGKNYLVNGGDLRSLQEMMGHANITTTEKYLALNLNDLQAKHHQFTPLRAAHMGAQSGFFAPEPTRVGV